MDFRTVLVEAQDTTAGFSCGQRDLDRFLARYALQNMNAHNISRTFVWRRSAQDAPDLPSLIGFYTLSMANVEPALVTRVVAAKLPRYPMPVALLGRFAIDQRAQGRGFGAVLLADAVGRVIEIAELIACMGVVVDAKNDAGPFYEKHGFKAIDGQRLFLPLASAKASFLMS